MPGVACESSRVVLVVQGQQGWVPMTAHPLGFLPSGTPPPGQDVWLSSLLAAKEAR